MKQVAKATTLTAREPTKMVEIDIQISKRKEIIRFLRLSQQNKEIFLSIRISVK